MAKQHVNLKKLPEEDDEHTRTMYFDILALDES